MSFFGSCTSKRGYDLQYRVIPYFLHGKIHPEVFGLLGKSPWDNQFIHLLTYTLGLPW